MTKDDIIRMAREAGATRDHPEMLPNFWTLTNPDLERFAALVAAAEREACAKVCEAGTGEPIQMKTLDMLRKERERIALAIRARGQG